MKFKLIEEFDETRSMVQEYMYDAMDELNNASLEEYIQWFMSELTYFDETVEQAVTDAYIEACDYGMIKGVEKTRLTSELKEYIESHTDIIDDTDELMRQCPDHLQHELKIVLSKLDESLNESVLEEDIRPDLKRFIEQHAEFLDENNIEELYKQCPRELKIPLVRMLNAASLGDNIESIKRATFLADFYDDDELINLVLSVGEHANDVFDAFDYIMNNWHEFFTADVLNEDLFPELRQFFGKTKIKTYNDRGTTRLHKRLIDKLGFQTPQGNDYYAIHHVDGDHFKQNFENELLLLQSDHNKIHSDMMKQLLSNESLTQDNVRYILGYVAKVQQIKTYVEKLKEYCLKHEDLLSDFSDSVVFTCPNVELDLDKFDSAGKKALFDSAKNFLETNDAVVIKLPFKHKHKYVITLLKYFKPGLSDEHLNSIIIE